MKYVAYCRVSTAKQGKSGLGLEAQQEAVRRYALDRGEVLTEFIEVESGKVRERPQLAAALIQCRKQKATLLIAKLDRLSRNVAFIATLMEGNVPIVAVDNPTAETFTLHILSAVAQQESKMISARTKDALAAAKARGVKLGGWRGRPISRNATAAIRANADKRAADVMPAIRKAQAAGITTYKGISASLNEEGITTARGSIWRAAQVRRVIARAVT